MQAITRRGVLAAGTAMLLSRTLPALAQTPARMQSWALGTPRRTGIHDVAPAPDGGVWFTAQASGHLGWFDPKSGKTELVALGGGSAPHGVIQGPDHAAWITDGGQNAIVRVGWPDRQVRVMRLPAGTPNANLNTCAFDGDGDLWYTGQNGWYGKVSVKTGQVSATQAPRGHGAYGICATPAGDVWFCSLASSYIARIDRRTGEAHVVDPPTRNQGARRVWSDGKGRIWVSEWNSGQLSMHDSQSGAWRQWKAPGASPRIYAVYVDEHDTPWVSDWGSNAILSFDLRTEKFERHALPRDGANVRQILGRPGEIWLPESGTEHITVIRTA
ncbi:Vgb family protein [Caenimonas aquaedulcis]|uniref:Virginiamycin B lyase n=1 Tax=Caenimonas aquaedulcis TaxID=2793270 RepID=A0A931H2L5_9BURK|nr:lyase [Caenimonas aquaedulcis]MBG9387368.1 lyase [Caenimonas aquaedulcis]